MSKNSAISDEQIIAALMQQGTIRAAAAAAGIAERTIYDRMKSKDFRAEYMAAKTEIIRAAVFSINSKLSAAVETVSEIMQDPATNNAVRLQAAQIIINNAAKFAQRLQTEERDSREEAKGLWDFD